ncbi:MAG: PQ-loop repeat-containing protein [Candidatus Dependentiae bacterium]
MKTIMHVILWGSLALHVVCFITQILTNYARRSVKGLSRIMVLANFAAYLLAVLYAFLLRQPTAFKVMFIAGVLVSATLIGQCILYDKKKKRRQRLEWRMFLICLTVSVTAVWGHWEPLFVGNIAGWATTLLWFGFQIPQLWYFHTHHTVKGFNPLGTILLLAGSIGEIFASLVLGLPPQTLWNGVRGMVFSILFLYEFAQYDRSWGALVDKLLHEGHR